MTRLLLTLATAAAVTVGVAGTACADATSLANPGAAGPAIASTPMTTATSTDASAAADAFTSTSTSTSASAAPMRWGCSEAAFSGTALLGPKELPNAGVVGLQLYGYRRTDSQAPAAFLLQFRNAAGWIYPPDNGYTIGPDNKPVEQVATIQTGQDIDRYGSVYGSFLAPAGTPYAQRSLPPSSLVSSPAAGCNYHEYQVLKPFAVDEGPIAPWFDQPGGGLQYQLDSSLIPGAPSPLNVLWLLDNGYLKDVTPPVGP